MTGIRKPSKRPSREKNLSAAQLEQGLKKGKLTYVMTLIEIKPNKHVKVPNEVLPILNKYDDVMPPELLKKLPFRRSMNHKIEHMPEQDHLLKLPIG